MRGLIALGVLKIKDTREAVSEFIANGGIYAFFPHGLGHHLGLDVHDVGPIDKQPTLINTNYRAYPSRPWPRCPKPHPTVPLSVARGVPLAEGMVITVEPGLYFNEYTLSQLYLCHEEFKALVDMEVLERYIRVGGVRIEDDVLITEDGYEVLSEGASKWDEVLDVDRGVAEKRVEKGEKEGVRTVKGEKPDWKFR